MDDIYQSPTSKLDDDDEKTALCRKLYREQSYVAVLLATVFGLIPSLVLVVFLITQSSRSFVPLLVLLIPGIVVGLMVKFCGRAFDARVRLPAAIITAVVMFAFIFLFFTNFIVVALAFIDGLIVMGLSRRNLSYAEESAIYAHRLGKISL